MIGTRKFRLKRRVAWKIGERIVSEQWEDEIRARSRKDARDHAWRLVRAENEFAIITTRMTLTDAI